jgi:hypothetical protein
MKNLMLNFFPSKLIGKKIQLQTIFFAHRKLSGAEKKFAAGICPILNDKFRSRVARWQIFRPKIPIWVNFGGSCHGIC